MSFFLAKLTALSIQIVGFRAIFFQKTIQDLFGNLKILTIRFYELLQKLLCRGSIFVFKLWIDFEAALEEPIVAFLQVLWQSVIQRLELEAVLLWLLEWCGCRWLTRRILLDVQGQLLCNLFVIHFLFVLRIHLLFVHGVRLRLHRLLLFVLALDVWTLVLVLVLVCIVCAVVVGGRLLAALILPL